MIPLCVPHIQNSSAIKYINDCIDTEWVSSAGGYVPKFEDMLAQMVGTKYAVAVNSGTSALHLAMIAAGVLPNDEVVIPTITFVATANAVRYVGAYPVFIDCEDVYCQMDMDKLRYFLYERCVRMDDGVYNKTTKRRVKAVVVAHLLGHPSPFMQDLLTWATDLGLVVIEDAAQALGARTGGLKAGGIGDIGCFSFNGNKLITCGAGGAVVTNKADIAAKVKHLSTQATLTTSEYEHDMIGYNYRMSNLHAALGCSQLEDVYEFIHRKRCVADFYRDNLQIDGISVMWTHPRVYSTFWLSTIFVDDRIGRDPLQRFLKKRGIETRAIWQPLHLLPMYRGCYAFDIYVAHSIRRRALNLPSSVGLKHKDQKIVCDAILEFVGGV